MMISRSVALGILLVPLACAHAPTEQEPTPVPAANRFPLPRSSIAAILLHRGDLELTAEQVERLQARDDALYKDQLGLRNALQKQQQSGVGSTSEGTPPATPSGAAPMGGGRRHGMRNPPPETKPKGETLEEQLDDSDTRAYLAAEADVLTEQQRDPAREIASKYREDLYDQREQARHQGNQ
jgi:hypothetical protein